MDIVLLLLRLWLLLSGVVVLRVAPHWLLWLLVRRSVARGAGLRAIARSAGLIARSRWLVLLRVVAWCRGLRMLI